MNSSSLAERLAADAITVNSRLSNGDIARTHASATAVLNYLATHPGVSDIVLAQVGFAVPNVLNDFTDHIARAARCATVGHVETSEVYDDEQGQRLYTCACCYREQVRES